MSGHKRTTITLSQEEYRKLHEAEMSLRFMNEGMPELINQTRQEIDNQLKIDLADMQYRQDALLHSLDKVNSNLRTIEYNASQALIDQQSRLNDGFIHAIDQYHSDTESTLINIESQVQTQL